MEAQENSIPSWFGFIMTLKDNLTFTRNEIVEYLEDNKIQTRNLFAGNMTKHPMFESMILNKDYRVVNELSNTNKVMNNSFWIGVYPGLTQEQIEYIVNNIKRFLEEKNGKKTIKKN
jgi:CDP-6-deoxy-D-xylo-4-hexulose-3-dehydrase